VYTNTQRTGGAMRHVYSEAERNDSNGCRAAGIDNASRA